MDFCSRPIDTGPAETAEAGDDSALEVPNADEARPRGVTRPGAAGLSTTPTAGDSGPYRTTKAVAAGPTGLTGARDGGPTGAQILALLTGLAVNEPTAWSGAWIGLRLGGWTTGRWRAGALRLERASLFPPWNLTGRKT